MSEDTEKVLPETKKPVRKKTVKGKDKDLTTKTREILQEEEQIQVNIASTEKDSSPVFVGINGHSYLIKRDSWVSVPKSIVAVLDNAVLLKARPIKEGNDMRIETYEVSRFAHSTKG